MGFSWILGTKPKTSFSPKALPEKLPEVYRELIAPKNRVLFPYQKLGTLFMTERRNSLLADEMGLGKTVQAICFCNVYPNYKRVLIICPASLIINWQREIAAWSTAKYSAFHIVSYAAAQHETETTYDVVILDEAHYIKNHDTQRSAAVSKICKKAKRVLMLTGTPMPNGAPLELWPLLQILNPAIFDPPGSVKQGAIRVPVGAGEGGGFFKFAKRYCGAKKLRFGKKTAWDFSGATNLEELDTWLRNVCMMRRLKKDVLPELPEKRRQIITLQPMFGPSSPVDFRRWTEDDYEAHIKSLQSNRVAFAEISSVRHSQALEKVNDIADLIYEQPEKCVIFAHHLDVIEALHRRLSPKGAVRLTGQESAQHKQMSVDVFQDDPNCRFFIGSLTAAGTGLTLTAASHVIFAEIDWTPKTILQAEDRCHRIGQKDGVLVQYFVTDGSIDAHIAKLLVKKFERLEAAGLQGST